MPWTSRTGRCRPHDPCAVIPWSSPTAGASDEEAEHTLAAYRKAFAHGADGVECDVRLTADHHLVCVHDRKVNRTSNGDGAVSTLELATLEELDWASWKRGAAESETPEADPERGHLLTLRRLLDTLVDTRQEVVTLIETKHPTRHGADVELALVQALRFFDLDTGDRPGRPHVRVMSFSRRALLRVHKVAPQGPARLPRRGRPVGDGVGRRGAQGDRRRRPRRAAAAQAPPMTAGLHRRGHQVYAWTVDEEADVDRCLEQGVDVIITNRPAMVIARMAQSD